MKLVLCVFILSFSLISLANDKQVIQKPILEKRNESELSSIDKSHRYISDRVHDLANYIDSFFGNERIDDRTDRSRIRIYNDFEKKNREKYTSKPNYRIRLVHPRMRRKFRLILQNDDENKGNDQQTTIDRINDKDNKAKRDEEDDQLRAAVQYLVLKTKDWDVNVTSGVKIKAKFPPTNPYSRAFARKSVFRNNWEYRFGQTIEWSLESRLSEQTSIEFDRRISKGLLFRFGNYASWRDSEENDQFSFSHGPSIYYTISKRRMVGLTANVQASDENTIHATSYNLSLSYRQNLHKEWFFYELGPFLKWPKELAWRMTPGINLRVELFFGD